MATVSFSSESQDELAKTLAKFPIKSAATLPVLWIAQRQFGWLSPEVLELCAETLEQPYARVLGVASFYTMFALQPRGKFHIQVCRNLSCAMFGAEGMTERLCKKLGVEPGGTTADKMFTVEKVECLAACGIAPVVQVNEEYHGNMKGEKLDQLIDVLREKAKMSGPAPRGGS